MRRVFMALGLLLGLSTSCHEGVGDEASPHVVGARQAIGPVVARVNGEAIGLEEVRAVCAASGLSPEEALARLIDERVLAQYAEARGYGKLADTQSALARARVRALLGEIIEGPGATPDRSAAGQRLESVLGDLRSKTKVIYDEKAVRQALSNDGTLGSGT